MIAKRLAGSLARRLAGWLLLALLVAACGGAPAATSGPPPTATPRPWRPPTDPVTAQSVTELALLGVNRLPQRGVFYLAFSQDSRYMVTAGADDTLRLWDVTLGRMLWSVADSDVARAHFVLGDTQLAATTRDDDVVLYRVSNGGVVRRFRAYPADYPAETGPSAVSPDGELLAVGAADGVVTIWQLAEARQVMQFTAHASRVEVVLFGPDGTFLATASNERIIRLWNLADGSTRAVLADFDRPPQAVALSPDGSLLAMSTENEVRVWATDNGAPVAVIATQPGAARRAVALTATQVIGGGSEDTVPIWSVADGRLYAALPGHGEGFEDMALSPVGPFLVTVAFPGAAYLWNLAHPDQRFQLSTEADQLLKAGWTPDGRVLVLTAADGPVWFWGIPGEPLTPTPQD